MTPSALSGSDTNSAGTSGARRYVTWVVAGFALMQAIWIVTLPPFRGVDEFDHAYRASAVAHGQVRSTEWAVDGRGLLVAVPESLVAAAHEQCASLAYTGPDNCSPAGRTGGLVLVGSGAGGYNPVYYVVVGVTSLPFDGVTSLYAMRITSALMCLLLIGGAAWAVAIRRRSSWSRVGMIAAVPPVMLYSTVVVAPNGLEMCAALCFWSSLLSLDGSLESRRERALIWLAAGSGSVLIVGRMLGPLFALCIFLSVWALRPGWLRHVISAQRRTFLLGSGLLLLSGCYAVAWFLISGAGSPEPDRLQGGVFRWIHPVLWLLQSIAAFPTRAERGALIVYPVVFFVFGAILTIALRRATVRARVILIATVSLSLAIPLMLTWATYAGRGSMWQGRYGLPFAIGIVLLSSFILDESQVSTKYRAVSVNLGAAVLCVATIACLIRIRDIELQRPASILDSAWAEPSRALITLVASFGWAALLIACRRPSHG
jgi:hypothetical protein